MDIEDDIVAAGDYTLKNLTKPRTKTFRKRASTRDLMLASINMKIKNTGRFVLNNIMVDYDEKKPRF